MLQFAFTPQLGLKSFLSPAACRLLVDSFQANLQAASLLATGTPKTLPAGELFGVMRRSSDARLLHHASHAWNLLFFLQSLTDQRTAPSEAFIARIDRDFGSFPRFKRRFHAHATSIIGSGWCWLVRDLQEDRLCIITTHNGASPLFHQNRADGLPSALSISPVLGLNCWESAYVLDYGIDRESYVDAWWSFINWNRVKVLLE